MISEAKTITKPKYPSLWINKNLGLIVLVSHESFSKAEEGTFRGVVVNPGITDMRIGDTDTIVWEMDEFERFYGTVTLKDE